MGDIVFEARFALDDEGHLERWNGWLVPYFTREEVDRYGDYVQSLDAEESELAWIEWDQDVLVVHHPENAGVGEYAIERIVPVDGLYPLGDGWTWQLVESAL